MSKFGLHRLLNFSAAYATSLLTLLTLILWALFDNSFFAVAGGDWRFWDELAARYILFLALIACGVISTGIVFLCLFMGSRRARSLKGYLAAIALVGLWLACVQNHERIEWAGFVWHWKRMVPGLKADAKELCAAWPTKNGELPYLGKYEVLRDWSPEVFCESWKPGFRFNHTVFSVRRSPNQEILFDLGKFGAWIEYRADSSEASVSRPNEVRIVLEPNWTLVWHGNVGSLGPR